MPSRRFDLCFKKHEWLSHERKECIRQGVKLAESRQANGTKHTHTMLG